MANTLRKRRPRGSGGITQRKDGTYQGTIAYRDEFDCLRKKYFYGKTKAMVQDAMRDFLAGGSRSQERPDGRTVDELIAHLVGTESVPGTLPRSGRLLPRTAHDYRNKIANHIAPKIGRARIVMVTPAMVDILLMSLVEEGKRRTAVHVRYILGMLFDEAVRLKWTSENPVERSMKVSIVKEKRLIYSVSQLRALAEAAPDQRTRAWILLAGMCGLRKGEIAGLMWSSLSGADLTIERQRDRETTKTASGKRVIRLPEPVMDALRLLPRESLWMFPAGKRTVKSGRSRVVGPVHPSTIYHKVQEAIEAAGTPKLTVHDLRHSANNILKQMGVDAATRRDILGHASTATTNNVYSQTVDTEIISAMALMAEAWKDKKEKEA